MLIEDVRKLSPEEIFLYWCKERQAIYVKKQAGLPKPWTDDTILQNYYFTNVYREQDRTTVWFRENIRGSMAEERDVILATIIFRWFNLIETGKVLVEHDLLRNWRHDVAVRILRARRDAGEKIFTGAFMINSPGGEEKLGAICRRIEHVWYGREALIEDSKRWTTLQRAHERLKRYEGLGGFMAYEVVTDLRWTSILRDVTDRLSWCNPGPGAIRGMYRLLGRSLEGRSNSSSPAAPKDWAAQTQRILTLMKEKLPEMDEVQPFEAHEVEMVLCETDKYQRLLSADGRSKRNYPGAR